MDGPRVFRWLLDVDPLWPTPAQGPQSSQSTAQWGTGIQAEQALRLLSHEEPSKVLRFYRPSDAKLCLASCLLKRSAISQHCGVPWSDVALSEDSNRKPCYKPQSPSGRTLAFNVSHHGALVALVGCSGEATQLGVDVVRLNWEKDYAMVMKDGFEAWAHVYEMVFSEREIHDIAHFMPSGQRNHQEEIQAKLRHFYAHWCLKEAYVKMTGEALLASWLKDLEFRNVEVPLPRKQMPQAAGPLLEGDWGQSCTNVEIWFHGKRLTGVRLEIQAFRDDYMIATAASNVDIVLDAFEVLDVDQQVYPSN